MLPRTGTAKPPSWRCCSASLLHSRPDPLPSIRGLAFDEPGRANAAAEHPLPQLVRVADELVERHAARPPRPRAPLRAAAPGTHPRRRNGSGSGPAGGSSEWVTPHSRRASTRTARIPAALGRVPGRQGDRRPRRRDPCELAESELGLRQVIDREVGDHRVEATVRERQFLCVCAQEPDARVAPAGERHHALCAVDTCHDRAPLSGSSGRVTRSAPDIEDVESGAHPGSVQQRFHEPGRDAPGEQVVALGLRCPALTLERLERLERLDVARHRGLEPTGHLALDHIAQQLDHGRVPASPARGRARRRPPSASAGRPRPAR